MKITIRRGYFLEYQGISDWLLKNLHKTSETTVRSFKSCYHCFLDIREVSIKPSTLPGKGYDIIWGIIDPSHAPNLDWFFIPEIWEGLNEVFFFFKEVLLNAMKDGCAWHQEQCCGYQLSHRFAGSWLGQVGVELREIGKFQLPRLEFMKKWSYAKDISGVLVLNWTITYTDSGEHRRFTILITHYRFTKHTI